MGQGTYQTVQVQAPKARKKGLLILGARADNFSAGPVRYPVKIFDKVKSPTTKFHREGPPPIPGGYLINVKWHQRAPADRGGGVTSPDLGVRRSTEKNAQGGEKPPMNFQTKTLGLK